MDVVGGIPLGVGLDVAELDHERRAFDEVVVANARLGGAGPGEVDRVPAAVGLLDEHQAFLGNLVRHCAAVRLDDPAKEGLLFRLELGGGDPLGRLLRRLRLAGGTDVLGALGGDDPLRLLRGIEGADEIEGELLFGAKDTEAGLGEAGESGADLGGIGSEELRRAIDDLAVANDEVEREVMPFDGEAPGSLLGRRAEDREEVAIGIADVLGVRAFLKAKHLVELHDRPRLVVAGLRDGGAKEIEGPLLLRRHHLAERQPLALELRDEVPADAAGILPGLEDAGLLFGGKRGEPDIGRLHHGATGRDAGAGGSQRQGSGDDRDNGEERGSEAVNGAEGHRRLRGGIEDRHGTSRARLSARTSPPSRPMKIPARSGHRHPRPPRESLVAVRVAVVVGLVDVDMDLGVEGEIPLPRLVGDPGTVEVEIPEAVVAGNPLEPRITERHIDEVERAEGRELEERHP